MEPVFSIATPRLTLYALSLDEISSLIRGERVALAECVSATIPPEWPGSQLCGALRVIAEAMAQELGDAR